MDCEITKIRKAPMHFEEPQKIAPMDAEAFSGVMSEIDRALNPPVVKKLTPVEWVEKWNSHYEVGDSFFVPIPERGWSEAHPTSSKDFLDDDGNAVVNFEGVDLSQSVSEIRRNNRWV